MSDPLLGQELLELTTNEAHSVISNDHLRQPKSGKQRPHFFDDTGCEDIDEVHIASIHFEWPSITTRMFLPSKGHAFF